MADQEQSDDAFEAWAIAADEALEAGHDLPPLATDPVLARRQHAFLESLRYLHGDHVAHQQVPASPAEQPVDGQLLTLPTNLGRFRLQRVLGRGSFGLVFLAVDPNLNRQVAIKIPRPQVLMNPELSQRFIREAQAAARLNHPNLLAVYEAGEIGAVRYYATAYCAGGNLEHWLAQHERLTPRAAAILLEVLASAMRHAHAQGVLHRDLKPGNILLEPLGAEDPELWEGFRFRPRIGDFGLAKLREMSIADESFTIEGQTTETNANKIASTIAMLGTPAYMAPEQITRRSEEISPATDVYGLGAIFYEILVGHPPYIGADARETMTLVTKSSLIHPRSLCPEIPSELEAICLRCLCKNPADRYPSAGELAADLKRYIDATSTTLEALPHRGLADRFMKHPRVSLIGLFCVLLLTVTWWRPFKRPLTSNEIQRVGEVSAPQEQQRYARAWDYTVKINLAREYWSKGLFENARTQLESLIPQADEPDLRGFEWHYLFSQVNGFRSDNDRIEAVSFAPDGLSVVLAGNRTIERRSFPEGQLLQQFAGRNGLGMEGQRISANARFVADWDSEKEDTPTLWDAFNKRCVSKTRILPKEAYQIAVSPDGRTVALGGSIVGSSEVQAVVRFWDTETNQMRIVWQRATRMHANVTSLRFSSDGKFLGIGYHAPAPETEIIRVADLVRVSKFPHTTGFALGIAISPDLSKAAIGMNVDGAKIFDVATERELFSLPIKQPVKALSLSPDGNKLAVGTFHWSDADSPNYGVSRWDTSNGKQIAPETQFTYGLNALAYSPDGRTIAIAGDKPILQFWSPDDEYRELPGHAPQEAWSVVFSPDGKTMISGGDDHAVRLWDVRTHQLKAVWSEHQSLVTCVAVSHDGKQIASGSYDGDVILWNPETGKPQSRIKHGNRVRSIAFSSDGQLLASADKEKTIHVWDLATGKVRITLTHDSTSVHPITFMDATHLVAREARRVKIWDVTSGQLLNVLAEEATITALTVSPDQKLIATGNVSGVVKIWSIEGRNPRSILLGHDNKLAAEGTPSGGIRTLAFSPDGKTLASGGEDKTIRLWNVETGRELICFKDLPAFVNSVAFSKTNVQLAAALHDGKIRLWETIPKTPVKE